MNININMNLNNDKIEKHHDFLRPLQVMFYSS